MNTSRSSALRVSQGPASKVSSPRPPPSQDQLTVNVMAPLVIGDAENVDAPENRAPWSKFEKSLAEAKALGADAVSTDVWWGLIEPRDGQFNFAYYDRMAAAIEKSGLKWVPILSFHQCGGNVGDDCDVKLPSWLGQKYSRLEPAEGANAPFVKSEQGNVSREAIAPWASKAALQDYESVMRAFQNHFANRRSLLAEINVSLGPAGELRYPSYNKHDQGTDYPTRGALQAYSALAVDDFRRFVLAKYGTVQKAAEAWKTTLNGVNEIRPPDDAEAFFRRRDEYTPYGKDLFDWYSQSLQAHGLRILKKAIQVFDAPGAPFQGIDIGAKVPGIHWRAGSDRAAELAAGLLQTSRTNEWSSDTEGHGYKQIIDVFKDAHETTRAPKVVLHYTALELDNGQGGPAVASEAKSLVFWVAKEAQEEQVPIKGENALNYTLSNEKAWENIEDALEYGGYEGITLLRVDDVVGSELGRKKLQKLANELP